MKQLLFLTLVACITGQAQAMITFELQSQNVNYEKLYRNMAFRELYKLMDKCAVKTHANSETDLQSKTGKRYVSCVLGTDKISSRSIRKIVETPEVTAFGAAECWLNPEVGLEKYSNLPLTVASLNTVAEERLENILNNLSNEEKQ